MKTANTHPAQADQILEALQKGRRITALDALEQFQCMRLGARIFELKQNGADIRDERVRTSTGKSVKRYFLAAEVDESNQPHHQVPA